MVLERNRERKQYPTVEHFLRLFVISGPKYYEDESDR